MVLSQSSETVVDPDFIHQTETTSQLIMQSAENEIEDWSEFLTQKQKKPVDLNTPRPLDLLGIPFLSVSQANAIHQYRLEYGAFVSVYELKAIFGFSEEIIQLILPYIKVSDQKTTIKRKRVDCELLTALGSKSEDLAGSDPDATQLFADWMIRERIQLSLNSKWYLKMNFVRKYEDTGRFYASNLINNLTSANFQVIDAGILKNFLVGDFKINFGQGLTISSGSGFLATNGDLRKKTNMIRPVTGASLFGASKGVAATVRSGSLEYTTFHSYCHNDTMPENFTGIHLEYYGEKLKLGITTFRSASSRLQNPYHEPYQFYNNPGKIYQATGFDFLYMRNALAVYGEICFPSGYVPAALLGIQYEPIPLLGFNVFTRYYPVKYYNPYAGAFSRNSRCQQEEGVFVEIHTKPKPRTELALSLDIVRFPWYKYQVDQSSATAFFRIDLKYAFTRQANIHLGLTSNYSSKSTRSKERLDVLEDYRHQVITFRFNQVVNENCTFVTRGSYVVNNEINNGKKTGFLIAQDFHFALPLKFGVIKLRYALFSADSWDERLYLYEDNLEGSFSFPSYTGQGSRFYSLYSLKCGRCIVMSAKYSLFSTAHKQDLSIVIKCRL